MRSVLLALVCALFSASAFADEPTAIDKLVKYHEDNAPGYAKTYRMMAESRLKAVARSRAAPVTGKTDEKDGSYKSFANPGIKKGLLEQAAAQADKWKAAADAVEQGQQLVIGLLPLPPVLGAVGRLQDEVLVEQVLSPVSVIVRDDRRVDYAHPPIKVQPPGGHFSYVIDGVSTEGVVDGASIKLPDTLEIFDTRKITRSNGSTETLFVLRPIDTAPALARIKPLPKTKKGRP